jgi:hypothetical protein
MPVAPIPKVVQDVYYPFEYVKFKRLKIIAYISFVTLLDTIRHRTIDKEVKKTQPKI